MALSAFTDREKIVMYEALLHDIQMYSYVLQNKNAAAELIENISAWSYAHRMGNGEHSDEEQQALIDTAFRKLRNVSK